MLFCKYNGEVGVYTLSMLVDNDMAMSLGRELFGYPKKIASIHFQKEKQIIHAWMERRGIRFAEINAKLGMKIPERIAIKNNLGANISQGIAFNFKHFIAPNMKTFDYNPRLIRQPLDFNRSSLINAKATLEFHESINDPWCEVEVVKNVGAFYEKQTIGMLKAQMIAEVEQSDFIPFAFTKWDKENF